MSPGLSTVCSMLLEDVKYWQSCMVGFYSENTEQNETNKQERILPLQRHDFTSHSCTKICKGPSQVSLPRQHAKCDRLLTVARLGLGGRLQLTAEATCSAARRILLLSASKLLQAMLFHRLPLYIYTAVHSDLLFQGSS